jgi:CPA1 family monovalent cation:H+ antiporter
VLPSVLLSISGLLIVISAIQPVARKMAVSSTVLLALIGILIGTGAAFILNSQLTNAFDPIADALIHFPVDSHAFLFVFLPVLVFHGALSLDIRRLARDAAPVLLLAVVAVVVTTAAIGLALYPVAGTGLIACLMLGAIVATTDPSAVVSVFRDIGADSRLENLVEGESLLNDAAAIALFTLLLNAIAGGMPISIGHAAATFFTSFAGGIAAGFVLARLALFALPLLHNIRVAEVTLTLAVPYLAYVLCDEYLGFSGVVAVAAAGLTIGNAGPATLRPDNWSFLRDLWDQLAFLFGSLVFILASMLVPRLILGMTSWDIVLIVVAVAAALVARAVVLFGMLPALAALGLSQQVPQPLKLTILWGGLRGSITLALALSVTENPFISPAVHSFVAIVATGFVLFTLLVNGTTLRLLVRWLGLDQLSPIDQALRNQVVAIGLAEVRDRVRERAGEFSFSLRVTNPVVDMYDRRAQQESAANTFDAALTDRDRIKLGLITFASHEKSQLLEAFREEGVSRVVIERLIRSADSIIDATRAEGRSGYLSAARKTLQPSLRFRIAQALHGAFGIDAPLTHEMTERFERLLLMYLIFVSQMRFVARRMGPVLGKRVAEVVAEITDRRRALYEDAIETLRLQYPGYAEALQTRMLRQIGLRLEAVEYGDLRNEALIGDEIYDRLIRDIGRRRERVTRRMRFNLQAGITNRVRRLPLFADLPEAVVHDIAMQLTMRFTVPGEKLLRPRRRSRHVYFVSSGEVAIQYRGEETRLGPGELFAGDGFLGEARTCGAVRAVRFSHLLVLRTRHFHELIDDNPVLQTKLPGQPPPALEHDFRRLQGELSTAE